MSQQTAAVSREMKRGLSTAQIAMIGVMTALMCILGPLSVPIGPVPISLTHISVFMAVYALGMGKGTISYLVYLLIGAVGLPVFSGFSGGVAKILGATGGYLIGFVFMALISGWVIDHTEKRYAHLLGMIAGDALCYLFGTIWFVKVYSGADGSGMSFAAALAICVYPFLLGDLIKMVISLVIGPALRGQLRKANLY